MSLDLRIPLDFERLPEFRMLCDALGRAAKPPISRDQIENAATRMWMRLWVELGYLAQSTNQPGLLTPDGVSLFLSTVQALFGEDCKPMEMLELSKCVGPHDEGFFCDRFAKWNPHLSGDYKKQEVRGSVNSAIVRQQNRLVTEAIQQGQLLPMEMFKKRNGEAMSTVEQKRALVLIKNVDNCLKRPSRRQMEFNEGLMADAGFAIEHHTEEDLLKFYFWLANSREQPCVPKSTEQVLSDFEELLAASKKK